METKTEEILAKILEERKRQLALWGNKADDLNTRNDWAAYICRYVSDGAYNGKDKLYSAQQYKDNLIKAATLCVAAIEAIGRLGELPETEIQKSLGKG